MTNTNDNGERVAWNNPYLDEWGDDCSKHKDDPYYEILDYDGTPCCMLCEKENRQRELDELKHWKDRAEKAEARAKELEEALAKIRKYDYGEDELEFWSDVWEEVMKIIDEVSDE